MKAYIPERFTPPYYEYCDQKNMSASDIAKNVTDYMNPRITEPYRVSPKVDRIMTEITDKDVYGQELDPNRLNIGNYKSNYMNPTNANTPGRPEAFTNHLESKLFSIDETLTSSVSRAIRKLNDLTGTPLPKAEAPRPYPEAKEPSPVMPCYTDRMYYLTASIERQLVELNDVLLRLEGF